MKVKTKPTNQNNLPKPNTSSTMQNQLYLQVLRRSQSEGPHQRAGGAGPGGAQGGVAACEPGPMAAWVHGRRRHVTEQQRPEHWLVPAVRLEQHIQTPSTNTI